MLGLPAKRRFYDRAEVKAADGDAGFAITLDGRPVRTPMGSVLAFPNRRLADLSAAEWAAQSERLDPASMPLTQLGATARDRIAPQRTTVIDTLVELLRNDLLCYREDRDTALRARQDALWQPHLDWMSDTHGLRFVVVEGLMPVRQPASFDAVAKAVIEGLDDWRLTGVQAAAAALKSVTLALVLADGRISADAAVDSACLDETHQMARWGRDAVIEERLKALRAEISAIAVFLEALDAP